MEERILETQQEGNEDLAALLLTLGFVVMMVLDVSLGSSTCSKHLYVTEHCGTQFAPTPLMEGDS